MKIIHMIIGIMLALVVCITPVAAVSATPVAAVSADDFEIDIDESGCIRTYTYSNVNDPSEEYIVISAGHTDWLCSLVTFKPANIPDAPTMMVDTSFTLYSQVIFLSQSVDEWEIKYYSRIGCLFDQPDPKYLKNAGIVNLKEFFGEYIKYGLCLKVSMFQCIVPQYYFLIYFKDARLLEYHIPDVD